MQIRQNLPTGSGPLTQKNRCKPGWRKKECANIKKLDAKEITLDPIDKEIKEWECPIVWYGWEEYVKW